MRVAFLAAIMASASLLTACQNTQHVVDTYKILQQTYGSFNPIQLSCHAKEGCEFARLDDTQIIEDGKPTPQAINRGLLRLEGSVFEVRPQYALSLLPNEHEVAVRFFPVSKERSEQFHFIHTFMANHKYEINMYRQRTPSSGSLLNVAMPGPLCVDLIQDQTPIRRFCRTFDVMKSYEFIEQPV
ncbi:MULTISPECIES: hypothetical protein [unclassified Acinetobacter]|uniref:hypothetical protein n=1 Tax=unclassified Acinetobacter TaxID=196816 RepID=UPI0035B6EDD3